MCPFCGTRTFLPERSNRVGLMFLAIMKDDAYIYNNNVITCIFWCKILGRADALNCAALRLSCIVIIASLHHISCVIVIIHLTLANSQGEVCDEEEAIYYTFGPGKAQKMGGSGCKAKESQPKIFSSCDSLLLTLTILSYKRFYKPSL